MVGHFNFNFYLKLITTLRGCGKTIRIKSFEWVYTMIPCNEVPRPPPAQAGIRAGAPSFEVSIAIIAPHPQPCINYQILESVLYLTKKNKIRVSIKKKKKKKKKKTAT